MAEEQVGRKVELQIQITLECPRRCVGVQPKNHQGSEIRMRGGGRDREAGWETENF